MPIEIGLMNMTKEEIVKVELVDIIDEFKNNRAMVNANSDKTLEQLKEELSKTAVTLLEENPREVFLQTIRDNLKAAKEAAKLSPGLGTALKDSKNNINLTTYIGDIGDIEKTKVTAATRFDLASITKLFTSIEALRLHQDKVIDVNAFVSDIYKSPYKGLRIPLIDMMRFKYELRTNGRLDEPGITMIEFLNRLFDPTITRNQYIYSDIPYIITKTLLPNTREFFNMYKDVLGYETLGYNTKGVITGSEDLKRVSDGKARQLLEYGIEPGHAGLFGTVDDIIHVLDILNDGFLNEQSIKMLIDKDTDKFYTPVYNAKNEIVETRAINHGTGVFIEHPEGLQKSQVISGLSSKAFSATGYTGGYSTFDLKNGFATCFLCNPVSVAYKEPYIKEETIAPDSIFRNIAGDQYPTNAKVTTEFVNGQKLIQVYDANGDFIEKRNQPGMLNVFKVKQLLTLYKLRLIKRVATKLATSDVELECINKVFNNGKVFKKSN